MDPHENASVRPALGWLSVVRRPSSPGVRTACLCSMLLLALTLAPSGVVRAQTSAPFSPNLVFERLSADQGLQGSTVRCILQDSRGYMWFGTEEGLNRYDGSHITVYKFGLDKMQSHPGLAVQSLWEDKQGTLWAGTWYGLHRFDRAKGTFSRFLPKPDAVEVWDNVIYDLCEDRQGTLWLTGNGLKSFDRSTGKFVFYPHGDTSICWSIRDNVDAVFEDRDGDLWLGTGGALERFDRASKSYEQFWVDESIRKRGEADFYGLHWIQKIYEDRSGILWLCTNRGPVAFNQNTGEFKPYRIYPAAPDSSAAYSVSSIVEDDSGVLWIGTWGGGCMTYNARADSFESHTLDSLAPSNPNSICALYKDRAGTLWIGTNGFGVLKVTRSKRGFAGFVRNPNDRVRPDGHSHSTSFSLQDNDVRFMYADPAGFISIGTAAGVERFFPKKGTFQQWFSSVGRYFNTGLVRSRIPRVLWSACGVVSVDAGILRVTESPDGWTAVASTQKAGLGEACSLFEDRQGILWMLCSEAGLCQFDPRSGKFRNLGIGQNQPFVASRMIIEDSLDDSPSGWALWIGTQDGLWHYDARADSFTRFGHDPRDPATIASNSITTLYRDRHRNLWIGTDQGLDMMSQESGIIEHYTVGNGLPDNAVRGILEDTYGSLWVTTIDMISKLDPRSRQFMSRSMMHVLPGIRFGAGCCAYADSRMYFGGNGGFVAFDPDSIQENTIVPPIVITRFTTFDTVVPLDSVIEEKKCVELSYKENLFSFEFAALNFIRPGNNQYAYKLEGYDTDWKYCGDQQYARYANVDPGSYTFRVKGSNNDGVWNENGTSLAILITPPWWKTTWFSVLLWVSAFGSVAGGVRFYERRKARQRIAELEREKALEKERARISQDMHDEVGSSLSEIAILSELAKKKPDQAEKRVEEISERTAELIENVSEIVWAMNPKNDTLEDLLGHIRRYAVKYLDLAGIACEFHAPETVRSVPVPSEVRGNLLLVVKEALHNVVKHSRASAVCIDVMLHGDVFELSIRDNGRGFAIEDRRHAGNGLASMCKRMADIGGICRIESTPDGGTEVVTAMPLRSP